MEYSAWMLRALSILAGAVALAASLSFAGSPHASAAALGSGDDDRLMRAYAQVQIGMPFSRLAALGFDTAKAERLPRMVLMERFMPKDHAAFDALDPAVKNCYRGSGGCTAYIFEVYSEPTVLLVQGGRVTWKMVFNSVMAGAGLSRAAG
jgi:hypothetical protein